MAFPICQQESTILAALRSGGGDPGLAEHLAACPSCALAVQAERWMLTAAAAPPPSQMPSAASLVLRAQLRARRAAAECSLRPLEVWRWAVWAVAALALALGWARGSSFLAGLWSSSATPAQAVFAAGVVILAGLPLWFRLRRDPA